MYEQHSLQLPQRLLRKLTYSDAGRTGGHVWLLLASLQQNEEVLTC